MKTDQCLPGPRMEVRIPCKWNKEDGGLLKGTAVGTAQLDDDKAWTLGI